LKIPDFTPVSGSVFVRLLPSETRVLVKGFTEKAPWLRDAALLDWLDSL
jgi:hypothetical protein